MNVLLLGLGSSGRAAAEFLLARGFSLLGWDDLVEKVPGVTMWDKAQEIPWQSIEFVVVSPGIAPTHPVYGEAVLRGIEVLGETELACRYLTSQAVGITGTNGKTTIALLVAHVLNHCGRPARAVGNVGEPLIHWVNSSEILVVELSSYQLETMKSRVLDAAVLVNITPDHLDRYVSLREYALAKWRIGLCLKPGAPLYVHDSVAREGGVGPCAFFNRSQYSEIASFVPLRYRDRGQHERDNLLAAWLLCKGFGVSPEVFGRAVESFQGASHRITWIGERDGVVFYDDSKGTNLGAVICAVEAMSGPVILIAGGVHKGSSYLAWKETFQGKVKVILAIGEAAEQIREELGSYVPVENLASLPEAVERAVGLAVCGDRVLLSPGCSSFDMFSDYAHRGRVFQECVQKFLTAR